MYKVLLILLLLTGFLSYLPQTHGEDSLGDKIEFAVNELNIKLSQDEKWQIKQNIHSSLVNEETGEKLNVFNLSLRSKKNYVKIEVVEAETGENALKSYRNSISAISSGIREETNEFGDGGIIVSDLPRDTAVGISFTKGNYYVSVFAGSREAAAAFAKIVESNIKN